MKLQSTRAQRYQGNGEHTIIGQLQNVYISNKYWNIIPKFIDKNVNTRTAVPFCSYADPVKIDSYQLFSEDVFCYYSEGLFPSPYIEWKVSVTRTKSSLSASSRNQLWRCSSPRSNSVFEEVVLCRRCNTVRREDLSQAIERKMPDT